MMALSSTAVASIDVCFPVRLSHKTWTSHTFSCTARSSSFRIFSRVGENCGWPTIWQTGQLESHACGAHAETSNIVKGNGGGRLHRCLSERRISHVLKSPCGRKSADARYLSLSSGVAKPPCPSP